MNKSRWLLSGLLLLHTSGAYTKEPFTPPPLYELPLPTWGSSEGEAYPGGVTLLPGITYKVVRRYRPHERTTRGIHQTGSRLHERQLPRTYQTLLPKHF